MNEQNDDNIIVKEEVIKKKSYGKTNKRKGSDAEREYAKLFREIGYEHCVTSRFGSRLHDNAGIDLIGIPYNIQIKAGKQVALKAHQELKYIADQTQKLFPDYAIEQKLPKILIHRRETPQGKKRDEFDEIVSMTLKDFLTLIKQKA